MGTRFDADEMKFDWSEKRMVADQNNYICAKKLTETEILRAMNSINVDLQFTSETENDFDKKRLPTLSFELWSTSDGLRHSYFEKSMRSQILTMDKSSMPENSKFSILVNELNRRFEVMDDNIDEAEKVEIINHFTTQLKNSGYEHNKAYEIIMCSLRGVAKKEEKRKDIVERYRSAADTLGDRMHKKLTEAVNWYRREREKEEREGDEDTFEDLKRERKSWKYKERQKRWKTHGKRKKKKKEWKEEEVWGERNEDNENYIETPGEKEEEEISNGDICSYICSTH